MIEKILTEKNALERVKQNGRALGLVPEKLKTEEVCLTAVEQCTTALQLVPEKLKTLELCQLAVDNDFHDENYDGDCVYYNGGEAIKYIPDDLRTQIKYDSEDEE